MFQMMHLDLSSLLKNGNIQNYNDLDSFLAKCSDGLNRTAPLKQKHVMANNSQFINKSILKAIMKRKRLKNKFIKYRYEEIKKAYNTQRKLCVSLVIKVKKDYFDNLQVKVFARCSLLFACYSLLFARCLLLFALCSLIFARCSLLFACCLLLFARCSLHVTY